MASPSQDTTEAVDIPPEGDSCFCCSYSCSYSLATCWWWLRWEACRLLCAPCHAMLLRRKQRLAIEALSKWNCRVQASDVGGAGLFAIRDLPAGTLVFEYIDDAIDSVEVNLSDLHRLLPPPSSSSLSPQNAESTPLSSPPLNTAVLPPAVQQAMEDLYYKSGSGKIWLPTTVAGELSYAAALNHAPSATTSTSGNDTPPDAAGVPQRHANTYMWWAGRRWHYYTLCDVTCGEELLLDYRVLPGTYGDEFASPKYCDPDAYFAQNLSLLNSPSNSGGATRRAGR